MSKVPARPAQKMHVKVLSPAQVYYEGTAETVSAANKVGPFDILANHANFFSLLTAGDIVVDTGAQKLHFPIKHGIVKATSNIITIFIYLPDE